MRLSGPPQPRCRYTLSLAGIQATVGGIFPPERATLYRALHQQTADLAYPKVRAEYDRAIREWERELIYGRPGAKVPVGVLGKSPLADYLPPG